MAYTAVSPPITAKQLREMDPERVREVLTRLGSAKVKELQKTWEFWARPTQLEPLEVSTGVKDLWIFNAGRGAGKTRSGAEWVRHRVKCGDRRIACVAPTKGDVRRVQVEGDSGLLNVCSATDKTYKGAHMGYPVWSPTNNSLTWENGAKAEFFSAEDPERLRGPQFFSAWADEVAAWRNQQEVWDMLSFCMRLGKHPKVMVTTTPKPTKLMRTLLKHPRAYITSGSTFDNADNLAKPYLDAVKAAYEGTRLGRQELYAEMLEEADGALWTTEVLDNCQVPRDELPTEWKRIVVSVDPAITSNEESDMTGIVVAGLDINGVGFVLEDATGKYTPQGWASKAISLYRQYGADRIVAERNQGGDMVRNTIQVEDETVPVRLVHASRGKYARAEPVSALYERGLVKHVQGLDELEVQMRTWEPLGSIGSPDRLDACLVGPTEVETATGLQKIEDIVVGTRVLTRAGYKPVVWSGMTRKSAKTLEIKLSNGYVVEATHEHPFWVQGKGWVPAAALVSGDTLTSTKEVLDWNLPLRLNSTERTTDDTLTAKTRANNATTFALVDLGTRLYTGILGNTTTGLSHQDTTSTTKTKTISTTISTILSVFPQRTTLRSMLKSFTMLVSSKWNMPEAMLAFGTAQRLVLSSTRDLERNLGTIGSLNTVESAYPATKSSFHLEQTLSTAPERVVRSLLDRLKGTLRTSSVQSAEQHSKVVNMDLEQQPALVSVVQVSESNSEKPVYNLHVEDCHEFVANGVLVHNCVWAVTDLMLNGVARPELQIAYSPAQGLLTRNQ